MNLTQLKQRPGIAENAKLDKLHFQFEKLLAELQKRTLPDGIATSINKDIEALNAISGTGPDLKKMLKTKQTAILKQLEKELKVVPKNYYRNLWLALGMSAFGIPLGVAFGVSMKNMGYLGIGLPIGMGIGIAVGASMDKKALQEGRQLDVEIRY